MRVRKRVQWCGGLQLQTDNDVPEHRLKEVIHTQDLPMVVESAAQKPLLKREDCEAMLRSRSILSHAHPH